MTLKIGNMPSHPYPISLVCILRAWRLWIQCNYSHLPITFPIEAENNKVGVQRGLSKGMLNVELIE